MNSIISLLSSVIALFLMHIIFLRLKIDKLEKELTELKNERKTEE